MSTEPGWTNRLEDLVKLSPEDLLEVRRADGRADIVRAGSQRWFDEDPPIDIVEWRVVGKLKPPTTNRLQYRVWHTHAGRTCPVDSNAVVAVKFDGGDQSRFAVGRAYEWNWTQEGDDRVVEYRTVEQPEPPEPPCFRPCTVWFHIGADGEHHAAVSARHDSGSMTITKGPALADWLAEAFDGPHESGRDAFLAFMARWLDAEGDADPPTLIWGSEEMP